MLHAQHELLRYAINTDVVYDAELIPTVGFERFFMERGKLKSWHIDAAYQTHYNNTFGLLFAHDDNEPAFGVYQGPAVKIGYTWFTKWFNRKWLNYVSPTLGVKYLWYDSLHTNTSMQILGSGTSYVQSEKCVALVPQCYIGQKRYWGNFYFDYYVGLQLPVKLRYKRIYYEESGTGVVNPNVPYDATETTVLPDVVFGIKLGYIHPAKVVLPDAEMDGE